MAKNIKTRKDDYAQWYLDVIKAAQLADYSPVRGCMVIRPEGYAIWEAIQSDLDRLGVNGRVEHDHGFIGPHGQFPFPLVRLGRALRKTEQGVWHFPTLVGTTILVHAAENG